MADNMSLKERTQMMNNKIKLHILGMPMNKLGNKLIQQTSSMLCWICHTFVLK